MLTHAGTYSSQLQAGDFAYAYLNANEHLSAIIGVKKNMPSYVQSIVIHARCSGITSEICDSGE